MLRDEVNRADEILDLRRTIDRLSQSLTTERRRTGYLVDALYRAGRDAASALTLPPVKPPPADKRKRAAEVAAAVLSDWQIAKVTPTYSTAVCEERIGLYADKLEELVGIQRADHPVRELRVYLLGDIVEGELIFPGQSHLIDASLYRQVMVDGPRILCGFLRRMAATFDKVHVVGVIGNHGALGGRARRDYHPETNADAFLYEHCRQVLDTERRITWAPNATDGERHWYAVDQVGSKRFFLFHGDQVKGYNGVPWYGFDRKLKGWLTSFMLLQSEHQFDYALSGHFHTPFREFVNGIVHWGNGSTESHNTYALEQLAAAGTPQQWLLFCHPERGVTAEYAVHLG